MTFVNGTAHFGGGASDYFRQRSTTYQPLRGATGITYSADIKLDAVSASDGIMFLYDAGSSQGFSLGTISGNTANLSLTVTSTGGVTKTWSTTGYPVTTGAWHNVSATWLRGEAGVIYVDGISQALNSSDIISGVISTNIDTTIYFGANASIMASRLQGYADNMMIWVNRGLTSNEVNSVKDWGAK